MSDTKNRIEWIDFAKGISIILVVYGHSGLSGVPFWGNFFSAIRMPFFFFCSGLLFRYTKYPQITSLIKRRYGTLVRPFFYFSLMVLLLEYFIQKNWMSYAITTLIHGWGGYALWFIPVLFGTELWFYTICRISKGNQMAMVSMIVISTILGYLTYYYNLPNNYNVCFILTSVLFYGVGNLVSPHIINFFKESAVWKIILAACVFFMVTLTFLFNPCKPDFGANFLVGPATYSAGIGGAFFMCCLAALICKISVKPVALIKAAVVFMGKNSYVVLAFHQIIILLLGKYINVPGSIERIIMWVILVILIETINRYFPYILGRK